MEKIRSAFKENSQYKIFLIAILAMGLSYGLYKGILDNYLAEVVSMNEFDKGLSEFFREMPGLMLVFILAALYTFSAEKLFKLGSVIMLAGMALHAVVPPTKVMLIFAMFIYSLGDHIQLGMKSTLSLQYSKPGCGGTALGYMNSMNNAGHLAGYLIVGAVFLIITKNQPFKLFFWISTALCAVGAFLSIKITGDTETDKSKSRFYFRKKYTKYYMLEVFYGARKQVFFTFGPYVLVLFYELSDPGVSLVEKSVIIGALGYFILPLDLIPDAIPVAGYADDLAALKAAYDYVSSHISPSVECKAQAKLRQWFG